MTATSYAGQYEQARREHMADDSQQWGLIRMVDDSEPVISELVTNAVEATGIADPQPRWRELSDLAVIKARGHPIGNALKITTRAMSSTWRMMAMIAGSAYPMARPLIKAAQNSGLFATAALMTCPADRSSRLLMAGSAGTHPAPVPARDPARR